VTAPIEPHLWASDLEASIGWYRSVLGFEPVSRYPDEQAATWCQLARGAASIMLAVVPDASQLAEHQRYLQAVSERIGSSGAQLSLYLRVEDADAVHRAAVAGSAQIIEDIWDAWWGGRQFTVVDPDGTWWTVFEPDSE
jgi:uncharacterized glyoxalase superfamily protein PhnB